MSMTANDHAKNPYGGAPGGGLTLPPYYRLTPSVANANVYFPGSEELGPDEMRISFLGSAPGQAVSKDQACTCIMVELGNDKRFFFDFGPGCMRNVVAMRVPIQLVNDIFLTHLHVDHYGDLPYLYAFAPWMGRWKPLRVHGPSGRSVKDGTKYMIEHMREMAYWHTDSFSSSPVGDGYEVEVNEFDFREDNGVSYDKDGVVIRHWRRAHTKDGAVAYRLDWNGLSFVWTGDGRADKLTAKYAQGVDVFVTEMQLDLARLAEVTMAIPAALLNVTLDTAHPVQYATAYLIKQVNPRLAMVTHTSYDETLIPEALAAIRQHWAGLFQFGAPDVVVVNVTKEAIWTRKAAFPDSSAMARLSPSQSAELYGLGPGKTDVVFPKPAHTLYELQEPFVRDQEYDPKLYYPEGLYRKPDPIFPPGLKISIANMAASNLMQKYPDAKTPLDALAMARSDMARKAQAGQTQLDAIEAMLRQQSK
jgi:ribonuclease BN (tRNA processing enzyme)